MTNANKLEISNARWIPTLRPNTHTQKVSKDCERQKREKRSSSVNQIIFHWNLKIDLWSICKRARLRCVLYVLQSHALQNYADALAFSAFFCFQLQLSYKQLHQVGHLILMCVRTRCTLAWLENLFIINRLLFFFILKQQNGIHSRMSLYIESNRSLCTPCNFSFCLFSSC